MPPHRTSRLRLPVLVLLAALAATPCKAEETTLTSSAGTPGTIGLSVANEVDAAIARGLDWLAARQRPDGSWSNTNFPALSALPAWAFIQSAHPRREEVLGKALAFIKSCARPDGGIYRRVQGRKGGGLSNYNTAICMTVLHASGDPEAPGLVLKARKFVAAGQHFGDDIYEGGFGYDRATKRPYADLLNTFYSVQAMRVTADAEDLRPKSEERVDIDWQAALKYVQRMQNPASAGTNEAGGFFYKPGESKAGATTNLQGEVVFRSYGSMTYAGMLSMIYAKVNRTDPRVRSAFDWAARHWSLEENPGMGEEGLYFFYNVLSRALAAYGQDLVPVSKDKLVNWREEAAEKLVSLQKIEGETGHGYWLNPDNRFWESDPVLVTAYSLLALQAL